MWLGELVLGELLEEINQKLLKTYNHRLELNFGILCLLDLRLLAVKMC
jgi:hypothetical protein